MSAKWTADQIPDQGGKVAIVTGANSGLGRVTALELARHGANVIVASRSVEKGQATAREIQSETGGTEPRVLELDLGSLDSVRRFAGEFAGERVDLLINNAGVMMTPREATSDGFELQFGTNHLGHFALTGLLLPAMEGRDDARVVTLSSNAHKFGKIAFDNLNGDSRYFRWRAYGQSKLANLLFALELDRRLRAAESTVRSLAAHPGYAATNLQTAAPPLFDRLVMKVSNAVIAQSEEMGALPTLFAATQPGLDGGMYIGPDGPGEHRGYPKVVRPNRAARDEETARRLWEVSEELTGVPVAL